MLCPNTLYSFQHNYHIRHKSKQIVQGINLACNIMKFNNKGATKKRNAQEKTIMVYSGVWMGGVHFDILVFTLSRCE